MTDAPSWVGLILAAAAVLGALAAIARFLHLGELRRGTLNLVRDWNGDDPRPGFAGRPSFPERMTEAEDSRIAINQRLEQLDIALAAIDDRTKQLVRNGGSSVADAVHKAARGVDELKTALEESRDAISRLDTRIVNTDTRITEHDKRNAQQRLLLQAELERRARELEDRLHAREVELDSKLSGISEDVFRASAARAILTELNFKIEPPEAGEPPILQGD